MKHTKDKHAAPHWDQLMEVMGAKEPSPLLQLTPGYKKWQKLPAKR